MSTSPAVMTDVTHYSEPGRARDFASVCEFFCVNDDAAAGFPLRGRLRMQSRIALGFSPADFYLDVRKSDNEPLPVINISFLTLAGAGGALPLWITEKIIHDTMGEGKALHRFLDLLNRRFWELLFLKSRLGGNPQYRFCSSHHALLFKELCFAFVGLEYRADPLSTPSGVSVLHKTMQHCWVAASGTGGQETLAALLSSACGCKVQVCGPQLVHLPVASQSKLILGEYGRLSRSGGVISTRALVMGGVLLRVALPDAELVDQYLPSRDGACLKLLRRILAIFYGQSLPLVALRLQFFSNKSFSSLGGGRCRLGWGAMLSPLAPCSQIVGLSAQMMGHLQLIYREAAK